MSRQFLHALSTIAALLATAPFVAPCFAQWSPANGPLMTRWASDVTPENVHAEYPRPQMVREHWLNLNGLWDYAITDKDAGKPEQWEGKILVPFPIESALSGVMKRIGPEQRLWYRRTFTTSPLLSAMKLGGIGKSELRMLLHFGAVDWEAEVWVNGENVGRHRGGYDPFTFDVTHAFRSQDAKQGAEHEIIVAVHDPTDAARQPRGKQVREPEGIWYTPTTGIWQTVWLEPVLTESYIRSVTINPDATNGAVVVVADCGDKLGPATDWSIAVSVTRDDRPVVQATGEPGRPIELRVAEHEPWTPNQPVLYQVDVALWLGFHHIDKVSSYFGFRSIALGKDERGTTRITLNGKPLFLYGPLDQGFWPDGLYTAPTDEALRYDIEVMKQLGFNTVRKHVKLEPARWYYWCDRLGLLVLQDMPSAAPFVGPGKGEIEQEPEWAGQFEAELKAMIDARRNHPSIVMWVPFNEGWGQYDTVRIANWIKQYDPTRLVDCASGWNDYPAGDVHDIHAYPGPASPKPEGKRAAMLGEFGGLGLPVEGHTWQDKKNWGYRSFDSREALADAYEQLVTQLRPMIGSPGLSAAVYTQLTDVEIEVNGLLTYDREIIKIDAERVAAANRKLYGPPPQIRVIAPTSRDEPQSWRYTTEPPDGDAWRESRDDPDWPTAPGGFGREGTPGAAVRTPWHTPDIWLRRTIRIEAEPPKSPHLLIHHDEDAEVYLNGVLAARLAGYTTDYVLVPIAPEARAAMKPGPAILAVHCRQTTGGQYIDVGIVDVIEP